jgi:hypothetical protein
MTYACPAWEFAGEIHFLKLQRLQNKILHTTGNFPIRILVLSIHSAFHIPYACNYITKLCRQLTKVIQNHENKFFCNIWQMKPKTENARDLNWW